jgi:hypothetical protein
MKMTGPMDGLHENEQMPEGRHFCEGGSDVKALPFYSPLYFVFSLSLCVVWNFPCF